MFGRIDRFGAHALLDEIRKRAKKARNLDFAKDPEALGKFYDEFRVFPENILMILEMCQFTIAIGHKTYASLARELNKNRTTMSESQEAHADEKLKEMEDYLTNLHLGYLKEVSRGKEIITEFMINTEKIFLQGESNA